MRPPASSLRAATHETVGLKFCLSMSMNMDTQARPTTHINAETCAAGPEIIW
jgi:hypothetical protein